MRTLFNSTKQALPCSCAFTRRGPPLFISSCRHSNVLVMSSLQNINTVQSSERSILVHLRMLLRPDYPQHSVFANGLHVVASFAPIVRWLCERHRDCCTLEVFVVNLETKDTFTGSVLLTQLQSRSFHSKDVQVRADVTDIISIYTGTAVEQVYASTT